MSEGKRIKWTNHMIEFMREHYPVNGGAWVAERLGLPAHRVYERARKLGINSTRQNPRARPEKAPKPRRAEPITVPAPLLCDRLLQMPW